MSYKMPFSSYQGVEDQVMVIPFLNALLIMWNSLPDYIVLSKSIDTFRYKVHKMHFSDYCCNWLLYRHYVMFIIGTAHYVFVYVGTLLFSFVSTKENNNVPTLYDYTAIWLFLFFLGLFQCWFTAMPLSPVNTYVYASFASLLVLDFVL